jgi:hypothetical protein
MLETDFPGSEMLSEEDIAKVSSTGLMGQGTMEWALAGQVVPCKVRWVIFNLIPTSSWLSYKRARILWSLHALSAIDTLTEDPPSLSFRVHHCSSDENIYSLYCSWICPIILEGSQEFLYLSQGYVQENPFILSASPPSS